MVRQVVQSMLNMAGYRALSAEDGATALAIYAGEAVDGAILDVDMPNMTGVELCAALRAQAAAQRRPILLWLMTGVVRPELVSDAIAAGARGVLGKPFTREELLACFTRLSADHPAHALAG
jgi:CheY-like chemotaxis protein